MEVIISIPPSSYCHISQSIELKSKKSVTLGKANELINPKDKKLNIKNVNISDIFIFYPLSKLSK